MKYLTGHFETSSINGDRRGVTHSMHPGQLPARSAVKQFWVQNSSMPLSRESRDAVADDDVRKVEGDPKEHLNACNVARQASTSDTHKLGTNAGFISVRNLYDQQGKVMIVMKVLAHRVVDGGLQKARAQKSFAHEKGGQVQYLVEWADSVVLEVPTDS